MIKPYTQGENNSQEHLPVLSAVKSPIEYDDEWEKFAFPGGYRRLKKCVSQDFYNDPSVANFYKTTQESGAMPENWFEDHLLIHVLQNVKNKTLNMIELGAGFGGPALTIAGLIDNTDISPTIQDYKILAIEAEPTHAQWCKEIFEKQKLNNCTALHAAAATTDGTIGFHAGNAATNYGQSIGGSYQVPCYRVQTLMDKYEYESLDFLHMDVQGYEQHIVPDCAPLLDKINFIFVGTHSQHVHNGLVKEFESAGTHRVLVDLPPFQTTIYGEFGPITCNDGIIFCERLK